MIDLDIRNDHIAIVTINRPEAANSLSIPLLTKLKETICLISNNPSVFCTIIIGKGNKVFCAGADLKERRGMDEKQVIEAVRYIGETITSIEKLEMPVIAALNGGTYGGGLELAIACDLRIAAKDIKLGLPETSLAIIPGAGGTQRLPRLIGLGKAKQMIYTAQTITAEEALAIGLVEELVDGEKLLDKAITLAKSIARNGPLALRQAKLAINQGMQTDIGTGLAIEHLAYKEIIPTKDRQEGLQAFRDKRKPAYRGE